MTATKISAAGRCLHLTAPVSSRHRGEMVAVRDGAEEAGVQHHDRSGEGGVTAQPASRR
jgi:hypothetical protein